MRDDASPRDDFCPWLSWNVSYMVEHDLLAICLVTDSSRGANLAFRWPPNPRVPVRLSRPLPSTYSDIAYDTDRDRHDASLDWDRYRWKPPSSDVRDYSSSAFQAPYRSEEKNNIEPIRHTNLPPNSASAMYEDVLGYTAGFLADLLSPSAAMCHQKFELVVDDLAFIGHPVRVNDDGSWGAPQAEDGTESETTYLRGRTSSRPATPARFYVADSEGEEGDIEETPSPIITRFYNSLKGKSPSPSHPKPRVYRPRSSPFVRRGSPNRNLKSFHLVLIIDRPDPSSVASTDLDRYLDGYYQQVTFKLTAAMLYEQGRSDFVAEQSDLLVRLRETHLLEQPHSDSAVSEKQLNVFFDQAIMISPLAAAIRSAYEAVISSSIAQVMVNEIPVTIQLPPGHLTLLKAPTSQSQPLDGPYYSSFNEWDYEDESVEDKNARIADELRYGWRIPPPRPWKAVLVFEDHGVGGFVDGVKRPRKIDPMDHENVNPNDIVGMFVSLAAPTISLSEISDLLDIELSDVYAIVRLLVYNRRAKVIDVVNPTLKNIYAPPPFSLPLSVLSQSFLTEFPTLPPLPTVISALSGSHRPFSSIVPFRDHRPEMLRALVWMLAQDLLIMLHVRVRIVVPSSIKRRVKARRDAERAVKLAKRKEKEARHHDDGNRRAASRARLEPKHDLPQSYSDASVHESVSILLDGRSTLNETSQSLSNRHTMRDRPLADLRDLSGTATELDTSEVNPSTDEEAGEREDLGQDGWNVAIPSFLHDPERAKRTQHMWLDEMCKGKDPEDVKWFKKVIPYFDGKRTTDEIMYRTEISRKQLRETLEAFDEYVMAFLHP